MGESREGRSGPFQGLKVVELGIWVAVPAAAAILADWGADVVKIEDPRRGDPLRDIAATGLMADAPRINPPFLLDNRSKRSVAVDLRTELGRGVLHDLVRSADVFMTNFRPEVRGRLGIGYDELRRLNARLVYASLTGYGERGPDRDRGGFDYTAFWARTGLMGALGEPDQPPPIPRPGTGDHATSLAIVAGVGAALLERTRTGEGQEVRLSLLRTGAWVNAMDVQMSLVTGAGTERFSRRNNPNPLFNTYRTRDGAYLQLVVGEPDRYWHRFCAAIDRAPLAGDARFSTTKHRAERCVELIAILDEVFAGRAIGEWAARLDAHEIYWGEVQSVADFLRDPQAREAGVFTSVRHPSGVDVEVVASPVDFSGSAGAAPTSEPELGQHTDEILGQLGYSPAHLDRLRQAGAVG